MRALIDGGLNDAGRFFGEAQEEAKKSSCLRRKCGSVIVKGGLIIGRGFNSPPRNLEGQRICTIDKDSLDEKVTDKTCCIHAEQRAIIDAIDSVSREVVSGSVIYFTSVDQQGNRLNSGEPYCTLCSKLALDVEIVEWVLERDEGFVVYNSQEYNNLSFNYKS